jgi:DNA-binding response OmpR family regulator
LNVEDFSPSRFVRTKLLCAAGFDVVEAGSGRDALAAAFSRPPAAALIDIHLPDTDGFDLCTALKAAHPELAVVLITAVHVTSYAREAALAIGASDFLVDPVTREELVGSIESTLRGVQRRDRQSWVLTDTDGHIIEASRQAADFLRVGLPYLSRRQLLVFFQGDRTRWEAAIRAAKGGKITRNRANIRPRERRVVTVDVELVPEGSLLRWTFRPIEKTEPDASES